MKNYFKDSWDDLKIVLVVALILGFVMLVTSCGTAEVRHDVQTVNVPVTVSCVVNVPVKPKLHTDAEIKAMSDYSAVLTLLLDRVQQLKYESELEAALAGCK